MRHILLFIGVGCLLLCGCRAPPDSLTAGAAVSQDVIDEREQRGPSASSSNPAPLPPTPRTREVGAAGNIWSNPLSPEEVVARMTRSFQSTPILRVTVLNRHHNVEYECTGWSTVGKARGEVRREGKLVFASSKNRKRVCEYVPSFKFANGTEGECVLVEYDVRAGDGGWLRLVDFDFACGPAIIACSGYLEDEPPRLPGILLGNMQAAKMTETVLKEQGCYWYHLETVISGDSITWDLYIDKATCEPLRQSRLITQGSKTLKEDVFDYTFEHLASDAGIHWEIDPARLKD